MIAKPGVISALGSTMDSLSDFALLRRPPRVRSGPSLVPLVPTWWQLPQLPFPQNKVSPALGSPTSTGATADNDLTNVISRQIWSLPSEAKDGISVPLTPCETTRNRSESCLPALKTPRVRSGGRIPSACPWPPVPSRPWQGAQDWAKSLLPSATACVLPEKGLVRACAKHDPGVSARKGSAAFNHFVDAIRLEYQGTRKRADTSRRRRSSEELAPP